MRTRNDGDDESESEKQMMIQQEGNTEEKVEVKIQWGMNDPRVWQMSKGEKTSGER